MKYFIDTEFIEGFHKPLFGKKRHFIDLISIGIIAEDGRKFYQISSEYNYNDADDWVKENVILPLYKQTVHGDYRNRHTVENFHKFFGLKNRHISKYIWDFCIDNGLSFPKDDVKRIADKTGLFVHGNETPIEFYAYYADYDWVAFCSLFGRMIDLPKGFPMYCKDLKQMLDEKVDKLTNSDSFHHFHLEKELTLQEKLKYIKEKNPKYPQQENEHNALDDAKWNQKLYEFISEL